MKVVVGGGLAGSVLTWHLWRAGHKVALVHKPGTNASQVGAGIINPVTGQRNTMPLNFYSSYLYAHHFYRKIHLESVIEIPIERRFSTEKAAFDFQEKLHDHSRYVPLQSSDIDMSNFPYFTIHTNLSSLINVPLILHTLHELFHSEQLIFHGTWDTNLGPNEQLVLLKSPYPLPDIEQVIFAQGHDIQYNPSFRYLPWSISKGEILNIKYSNTLSNKIVTGEGIYVIPGPTGILRLGGKYSPNTTDLTPLDESKQWLLDKYRKLFLIDQDTQIDEEVIDHQVGIRCALNDHLPAIGSSFLDSKTYCFSGFGSKGCLWIPLMAQQLSDYFTFKTPLWSTVSTKRFSPTNTPAQTKLQTLMRGYFLKQYAKLSVPINVIDAGCDYGFFIKLIKSEGQMWYYPTNRPNQEHLDQPRNNVTICDYSLNDILITIPENFHQKIHIISLKLEESSESLKSTVRVIKAAPSLLAPGGCLSIIFPSGSPDVIKTISLILQRTAGFRVNRYSPTKDTNEWLIIIKQAQ